MKRHKLLERQVKRYLKLLKAEERAEIREELDCFLAAVDQAYHDFDSDRALLERSQDLSSRELLQEKMRVEEKSRALIAAKSQMVTAAKMSALGEMAGGVAHEINNPLAVIQMHAEFLQEYLSEEEVNKGSCLESVNFILSTIARISKIIKGMRLFARDQQNDPSILSSAQNIISDTLSFCEQRLKHIGVELRLNLGEDVQFECRPVEVSQIILNLIMNAADAIENLPQKWIAIHVLNLHDQVEIDVVDSGNGIPARLREKIMQPFFTTKDVSKGTGLGLSVSKGIAEAHGGTLFVDEEFPNTKFVLRLPKKQTRIKTDAA